MRLNTDYMELDGLIAKVQGTLPDNEKLTRNEVKRFEAIFVRLEEVSNNGWISVKDRLPEPKINPITMDFQEIICFCDFGGEPKRTDVRVYKYGKPYGLKESHFWHGPQNMDGVVTHWMPLPEPPKEG